VTIKVDLRPTAVAVMTEYRGADRAREKSDEVDCERLQRTYQWHGLWEEELRKYQPRHRAVQQEIVPFDRGPNGARKHRATQL